MCSNIVLTLLLVSSHIIDLIFSWAYSLHCNLVNSTLMKFAIIILMNEYNSSCEIHYQCWLAYRWCISSSGWAELCIVKTAASGVQTDRVTETFSSLWWSYLVTASVSTGQQWRVTWSNTNCLIIKVQLISRSCSFGTPLFGAVHYISKQNCLITLD